MKPALQAKLLHVLQDAEFTKLGSNKKINVDVRVVTATNRDLEQMMVRGDFREDLYYRLKVIEAYVPPLRERRDEIPKLTDFFLAKVLAAVQPAGAFALGRTPTAIPHVRVAGQRPRAREHDQAVRHSAGRIARHRELSKPRLVANPPPMEPGPPAFHAPPPQAVAPPPPQAVAAPPPAAAPAESVDADEEADDVPPPLRAATVGGCRMLRARQRSRPSEPSSPTRCARSIGTGARRRSFLGVSYKTLLNKIKETGIERP
jgi:hypothetical protein